eukprot:TRINITY_DN184_c5_g1_i1.p1 TRINITY_DN184_c5_g1~~TRINITY_DN184_c5_g1_i1.p1  ORF type:complete len:789 (+),score=207.85 TRINITY_DN184_c5_g1_i1:243-2609(+)
MLEWRRKTGDSWFCLRRCGDTECGKWRNTGNKVFLFKIFFWTMNSNSFRVELERVTRKRATASFCCPRIDLVAVVFEEKELSVFRINYQRVFHREFSEDITSLCWSGDAKLVIVGFASGGVEILSVENGETQGSTMFHERPIRTLQWVDSLKKPQLLRSDYADHVADVTLPLWEAPERSSIGSKKSLSIPPTFPSDALFSVLLSADDSGSITISAFGRILLRKIHLQDVISKEFLTESTACSLQGAFLREDLLKMVIVYETNDMKHPREMRKRQKISERRGTQRMCLVDTSFLLDHQDEIHAVSIQMLHIQNYFILLSKSNDVMEKLWSEWLSYFVDKTSQYPNIAKDFGEVRDLELDITTLLATGISPDALQQFLARMLPEHEVKRLMSAFHKNIEGIRSIIVDHVQRTLETLFARLAFLDGLFHWETRFQGIARNSERVVESKGCVMELLHQSRQMLSRVNDVHDMVIHFLNWLHEYQKNTEHGDSSPTTQVYDMGTQDVTLIVRFLQRGLQKDHLHDTFEKGAEILEVAKKCVCGIISEESGVVGGEIHSDMDVSLGKTLPSLLGKTRCNFGIDPRDDQKEDHSICFVLSHPSSYGEVKKLSVYRVANDRVEHSMLECEDGFTCVTCEPYGRDQLIVLLQSRQEDSDAVMGLVSLADVKFSEVVYDTGFLEESAAEVIKFARSRHHHIVPVISMSSTRRRQLCCVLSDRKFLSIYALDDEDEDEDEDEEDDEEDEDEDEEDDEEDEEEGEDVEAEAEKEEKEIEEDDDNSDDDSDKPAEDSTTIS